MRQPTGKCHLVCNQSQCEAPAAALAGSAVSDKLAPSSRSDCHFSSVGIHHLCYKALELVPHTDTDAYAGPVNVLRIKAPSDSGYDKKQANQKGPPVLMVSCCLVMSLCGEGMSLLGIELSLKICMLKL